MSKCVMLADEAIDEQKDVITDRSVKDVVELILEEALVAAVLYSDKDCSRIGDFSVTEDFCQQFDQISAYSKDFDANKLYSIQNCSMTNQDLNLESGESLERSISLLTAKENIDFILDSLVKREEKGAVFNDCKIITEEILASNELRIENGQIHLEKKESNASEIFQHLDKTEVATKKKFEGEQFGWESLVKKTGTHDLVASRDPYEFYLPTENKESERHVEAKDANVNLKNSQQPCVSCSAEDSRQVLSDSFTDPKKPRGYAIAEEDVKKMAEEIQEISFNKRIVNSKEVAAKAYRFVDETVATSFDPSGTDDVGVVLSKNEFKCSSSENVSAKSSSCEPLEHDIKSSVIEGTADMGSYSWNISESQRSSFSLNDCENKEKPLSEGEYEKNLEIATSRTKTSKNKDGMEDLKNNFEEVKATDVSEEPKKTAEESSGLDESSERLRFETNKENESDFLMHKDIKESTHESLDRSRCSSLDNELDIEFNKMEQNGVSFNGKEFPAESMVMESDGMTFTCGSSSVSSFELGTVPKNQVIIDPTQIDTSIDGSEKKLQIGKEIETAQSDSRLGLEKETHTFKVSQSAHKEVKSSLDEQNINFLVRIKTESRNDGSFSLEKEVETFSLLSNESETKFQSNVGERSFQNGADFLFPEIGLSSNKSGCEIIKGPEEERDSSEEKAESKASLCSGPYEAKTNQEAEGHSLAYHFGDSNQVSNECSIEKESTKVQDCEIRSLCSNNALEEMTAPKTTYSVSENLLPPKIMPEEINIEGNFRSCSMTKTSSEENFIDSVESVIQIIDPADNSNDEESVSLSLPNDYGTNDHSELNRRSSADVDDNLGRSSFPSAAGGASEKKLRSGMTTIGPLKNVDHDPKDLICDVDYGKMTHVTSSRRLKKEDLSVLNIISKSSLLNAERSGEEGSATAEEESFEMRSFVNRDIASLTKVQKIREVMSYHPKPEEDFEDDANLSLPRLDLKDVESTTDERYKIPDVGVSILPFEIRSNNSVTNRNVVQNVHLVISDNGFNDSNFYLSSDALEKESNELRESNSMEKQDVSDSSQTNVISKANSKEKKDGVSLKATESGFRRESHFSLRSHATLSNVFRKASNKLIRSDVDFLGRNSKSLPRDASQLETSDSLRTILQDCHSSAANMLKKSKSVLKSTQGIFKTLSQNRFSSFHGSFSELEPKKFSPSETEVGNFEGKISLLKKEDFAKVKNIIKGKVEKTIKTVENTIRKKSEIPIKETEPKKEARQEEEQQQIKDRDIGEKEGKELKEENEKKEIKNLEECVPENLSDSSLKGSLIYKSQFVKSQKGIHNVGSRSSDSESTLSVTNERFARSLTSFGRMNASKECVATQSSQFDGSSAKKLQEADLEMTEEVSKWNDESISGSEVKPNEDIVDFIVMETVEGLPSPNLKTSRQSLQIKYSNPFDSSSIECNHSATEIDESPEKVEEKEEIDEEDASENSPPEMVEFKISENTASKKKEKPKGKKLSVKLRNFWSSAFGKVKIPPIKKETP